MLSNKQKDIIKVNGIKNTIGHGMLSFYAMPRSILILLSRDKEISDCCDKNKEEMEKILKTAKGDDTGRDIINKLFIEKDKCKEINEIETKENIKNEIKSSNKPIVNRNNNNYNTIVILNMDKKKSNSRNNYKQSNQLKLQAIRFNIINMQCNTNNKIINKNTKTQKLCGKNILPKLNSKYKYNINDYIKRYKKNNQISQIIDHRLNKKKLILIKNNNNTKMKYNNKLINKKINDIISRNRLLNKRAPIVNILKALKNGKKKVKLCHYLG